MNNFLFRTIALLICLHASASIAAPEIALTPADKDTVVLVAGDVAQCNVRGAQLTADVVQAMPDAIVLAPKVRSLVRRWAALACR